MGNSCRLSSVLIKKLHQAKYLDGKKTMGYAQKNVWRKTWFT